MDFKAYRKVKETIARTLTEEDFQRRKGIIFTLEGPMPFLPGDYLACDSKGEWPIKQKTMQEKYVQVAPAGKDGFAGYMREGARLAAQVPVAFSIEGMQGKAGDYLVLGGKGGWVVSREVFETTYELVE